MAKKNFQNIDIKIKKAAFRLPYTLNGAEGET